MLKLATFEKNSVMDGDLIDRLWQFASIMAVAGWGYFQSIHHLLNTLLFIFLCNVVLKTIMVFQKCIRRHKLNKNVDIMRCIQSLGWYGLLKEFAVTTLGLCFLTVIYKMLCHNGDSPEWLMTAINWASYFAFVVYTIMTFIRLAAVFPDTTIVTAIKWLIGKINFKKALPEIVTDRVNLEGESIKELENIVKEKVEKE